MDKYHIIRKIGSGSFATVYTASTNNTNELVALKIINKVDITKDYEAKLHNEMNILKKVNHENIVRLIDVVDTSYSYSLILEYMPGGDLYDLIANHFNSIKINEKKKMFHQIVDAVDYLHKNKISHGDLKLENILVDEEKNVKLTDFNLAYEFTDNQQNRMRGGSLEYAAPEIILGKSHYPCPSDIWSLGVIFYILQYGEFPFRQTTGESFYSLYMKIANANFIFPEIDFNNILMINTQTLSRRSSKARSINDDFSCCNFSKLDSKYKHNGKHQKLVSTIEEKKKREKDNITQLNCGSSTDTLCYNKQLISTDEDEMNEEEEDDYNYNNHCSSSIDDEYIDSNNTNKTMCELPTGFANYYSTNGSDNHEAFLKEYERIRSYYDCEKDTDDDSSQVYPSSEQYDNNNANAFPCKSYTINPHVIKEFNEKLIITDYEKANDLIKKILVPNPELRLTISDILIHPWMINTTLKFKHKRFN